jgi:tripartite-type tricarboxylate transporter receptor subunit TctC
MIRFVGYLLPALCVVCCSLPTAHASDWPNRPVRIISPASPGGASDTFGRILAQHFGDIFNQRFYVENRAGAGGLIGAAAAANAPPDGYTFVTSNVAYVVIAPAASANPGFDTMRDFTHIAYIGGPPNVFVVNPSMGVKTLEEFLALARRSGPLPYVSPGVGTLGHLTAVRFTQKANIQLTHIPNKGGSTAITDLVAGTVGFGSLTWTSALGQIRSGHVIPLAVSSENRLAEYLDVPTLKELGYEDLVATTWFGLSGPAGLPADMVQKLNKAVIQIMDMPAVKERTQRDAIETKPMTPEEFSRFMASEITKWSPLAKQFVKGE